jgi:hypothetical protein
MATLPLPPQVSGGLFLIAEKQRITGQGSAGGEFLPLPLGELELRADDKGAGTCFHETASRTWFDDGLIQAHSAWPDLHSANRRTSHEGHARHTRGTIWRPGPRRRAAFERRFLIIGIFPTAGRLGLDRKMDS